MIAVQFAPTMPDTCSRMWSGWFANGRHSLRLDSRLARFDDSTNVCRFLLVDRIDAVTSSMGHSHTIESMTMVINMFLLERIHHLQEQNNKGKCFFCSFRLTEARVDPISVRLSKCIIIHDRKGIHILGWFFFVFLSLSVFAQEEHRELWERLQSPPP